MTFFLDLIRVIKNLGHLFLAGVALFYYGSPSRKLKIIGVTGTDGKTTTAYYIYQLLKMTGKRVALISTVGVFINGEKSPLGFHVTTPSSFKLNKYLKKALSEKMEYVVVEVSSHALDQHRVFGLNFEVGTITNITNEHLDYHKNINNYLKTKIKLLRSSKLVVLNKQDSFLKKIENELKGKEIYTYSLGDNSDLNYSDIKSEETEKLTDYNKKNLLTAILVLKLLGVNVENLLSYIKKLDLPPGRLEYLKKSPFEVIIDFAHTPNAISVLLNNLKKNTKGKIIHVFGSAGKRDKLKRPDMGKVSSDYSDVIVLTTEDPRGENVHRINSDIRKGINKKFSLIPKSEYNDKKSHIIVQIDDRKEAIKFALSIANHNDCVVITGKGPEESMNINGREIPWSDIKITKNLLKNYGGD